MFEQPSPNGKSCASCHAGECSLRGAATRYPAYDRGAARLVTDVTTTWTTAGLRRAELQPQ